MFTRLINKNEELVTGCFNEKNLIDHIFYLATNNLFGYLYFNNNMTSEDLKKYLETKIRYRNTHFENNVDNKPIDSYCYSHHSPPM